VSNPCPYPAPPVFLLDKKNNKGTIGQDEGNLDLIRHRSTFEVICGNCDNSRVFNHRFLMSQFGAKHYLAALKFRCRRCGAQRYRLRIVADSLGEQEPLKMQHFCGVDEKFRD
jgi:hypothetical protein